MCCRKKTNIVPNLFEYATSELSQDAFFAWLLKWAEDKYKNTDSELHKTARELISKFLEIKQIKISTVDIFKQLKRIDLFIEINKEYNLVIEDKTKSKPNGEELPKNRKKFENDSDKTKFLYLKTGNMGEREKRQVEKEGYRIFVWDDIYPILKNSKTRNQIFHDFVDAIKQNKRMENLKDYFSKNQKKNRILYECDIHAKRCLYFWFNKNISKGDESFLALDVWICFREKKLIFRLHVKENKDGDWVKNKEDFYYVVDKSFSNLTEEKIKNLKFKQINYEAYYYEKTEFFIQNADIGKKINETMSELF